VLSVQLAVKKRTIFLSAFLGFVISRILIGSNLVTIPFLLFSGSMPFILAKRRKSRRQAVLAGLWPELLDHMISGLRSGLSIAETLVGLAVRGPEVSRPIFNSCQELLRSGTDIEFVFKYIKSEFNDPIADQVCEVLDFARGTGSRDTAITLRTLGEILRCAVKSRPNWDGLKILQ
jgi:tight adherence protein B